MVPFEPIHEGRAGIYTCGPTVYGPQHLGNMRSQLLPDLLRRTLTAAGYEVTFVTNITDKFYWYSISDGQNTFGVISGQPSRPREWAVSVKRNF